MQIKPCRFDDIKFMKSKAAQERVSITELKSAVHWYAVYDGDRILGCASLAVFGEEGRMRSLFILKDFRSLNLSHLLLDARLEKAKELGLKYLTAYLTRHNHVAWYKRNGFDFISEKNGISFVRRLL